MYITVLVNIRRNNVAALLMSLLNLDYYNVADKLVELKHMLKSVIYHKNGTIK